MNSYRSFIIFFIILLIAAAFWGAIQYFHQYGGDGSIPPLPSPYQKQDQVIRITADGFDPTEITIKKGEIVIFINDDTRPHWPASAVHPTHTQCPGFDALRGFMQGEEYRHQFLKSQTCPFHDHLNPSLKGTIIIR
ncbi:MAG: hypothetical protein AAB604_02895 [Patescibacteria group bacterium]